MGEVITIFNTLQTVPLTYCLYWVNLTSEMFITHLENFLINF